MAAGPSHFKKKYLLHSYLDLEAKMFMSGGSYMWGEQWLEKHSACRYVRTDQIKTSSHLPICMNVHELVKDLHISARPFTC